MPSHYRCLCIERRRKKNPDKKIYITLAWSGVCHVFMKCLVLFVACSNDSLKLCNDASFFTMVCLLQRRSTSGHICISCNLNTWNCKMKGCLWHFVVLVLNSCLVTTLTKVLVLWGKLDKIKGVCVLIPMSKERCVKLMSMLATWFVFSFSFFFMGAWLLSEVRWWSCLFYFILCTCGLLLEVKKKINLDQ